MKKTEIINSLTGKIRGYKEDGLEIFKGIPYAEPPIGDLRFSDTVEKEPWDGILEAVEFSSIAPQTLLSDHPLFSHPQSEDCLTLNIWTPGIDNEKLPVMFWIHGGGFNYGGTPFPRHNGEFLSRRGNLCVVTVNYRLGALGKMFIPNEVSNLGFTDQITALKWVNRNISNFGGNPNNITIFGESAGGHSVCTLLAMSAAKGLFQRAICQSGGMDPMAHHPEGGIRAAEKIFSKLGIEMGDLDALRKIPFENILEAESKVRMEDMETRDFSGYPPIIDGSKLPEHPLTIIGKGFSKDVDLLIGTNLNEYTFFTMLNPELQYIKWNELPARLGLYLSNLNLKDEEINNLIDLFKIKRNSAFEVLNAIITESGFRFHTRNVLEAQSSHSSNVYSYIFAYKSPVQNGIYGATHALEVPFVFGTLDDIELGLYPKRDDLNTKVSEQMMDSWTTFARNGNPNHEGIPEWSTYDVKNRKTILFGLNTKVENDPLREERLAIEKITT